MSQEVLTAKERFEIAHYEYLDAVQLNKPYPVIADKAQAVATAARNVYNEWCCERMNLPKPPVETREAT